MIAVAFELSIRNARLGEAWYEPYMEALRERNALPYDSADHIVTRGEMMFMISQILSE